MGFISMGWSLIRFCINSVIFLVSAYKPNIYSSKSIFNNYNNSILVPFNIKDHAIIRNEACGLVNGFNLRGPFPVGMFYICIPGLQRLACIWMLFPELA